MIRTLRRKFVLINMALVSVVLAVMMGGLLFSTARSAQTETMDALRRGVSLWEPGRIKIVPGGPRREPEGQNSPTAVFWVLVDESGTILQSDTRQVDIETDTLAQVTAAALAAGREEGTLADPALRFLCQQTPEGLRIGFADRSAEIATIRRAALRLAVVGALALAAFWVVSVFLARWALRPVEQAWQQQRQFVADASHELKTPLTVILASAELMARHPEQTAAQQRQWLDSIREEGGRMKQLIEDLLFLARADALRTPELSAVDWSEITESAALAFESVSFEQGVALDVDIAPGLTVLGSAAQLTQLAEILLDNACKYAAGSRHVTLMLRPAGGDGVLTVSSTGETLTPEQLSHLFERFYRADPARSAGGHGLGLAIAQSIAHTHRSRIKAQSADGVTTFTVTLPLHT